MPPDAASKPLKRRVAIIAIDIAGFSALAERHQALAAQHVAHLRAEAEHAAGSRGGRIFSSAGDGLMLEFTNAGAALEAAMALCEAVRDPPIRLGGHVGEALPDERGDLIGHDVNVAARLQAEAPVGGILVSQLFKDALDAALGERLAPRGRIRLAKMRETLSVYVYAPKHAPVRAAPDPVLAVLAFDNLSRDRDTRFFSDGVSEEILHAVSRTPGVRAVGSTSSFAFRGRDKHKAGKALGASHVLDGSVRRSGARVRVAAQLVETETGLILWSERYERELDESWTLQEEIAVDAASALALALGQTRRPQAAKLGAALFDSYLRAREDLRSGAPERIAHAEVRLSALVREAPDFPRAWSTLAGARLECLRLTRADRARLIASAKDAAERAIGLDEHAGEAYVALAALESDFSQWRARETLFERALDCEPSNPLILFRHGQFLISVGRVLAGYAQQARAFALDPLDPMLAAFHGYNVWAANSRTDGRAILEGAAARHPDNVFVWYMRLTTAMLEGDLARALSLRADAARLAPGLVDSAAYKSGAMVQELMSAPSPEAFMALGARFAQMAEEEPSSALDLAAALSVLGLSGPALAIFERALDDIEAWRLSAPEAARPHVGYETALLFLENTRALRMDQGFARLCARLGLAAYWRDTGYWPDCVEELAAFYDLRAACAQ